MDKSQPDTPEVAGVNESRRRLTKAGLAVPAVMGVLASRKVLADVPYQCTISGQISGNASPNGPATSAPCSLGTSYAIWKAGITSGSSPGSQNLQQLNASFSDVYYYKRVSGIHTLFGSPGPGGASKATLYQILNLTTTGIPAPPELDYGRKALLLWANAKALNPSGGTYNLYPLSEADAVRLFNALVTGTNFAASATVNWGTTQIKAYIDLLYH